MTYKAILVPFSGESHSLAALGTALRVAKRFDSHVEILHVEMDPRTALVGFGLGMTGATASLIIEEAKAAANTKSQDAHRLAEGCCENAGWTMVEAGADMPDSRVATWRQCTGRLSEEIARYGRVSDLIVVPSPDTEQIEPGFEIAEAALFDTGRPVMVAPREIPEVIGDSVAVAWNGSREAASAIAGALPYIVEAAQVTLVTEPQANGADGTASLVAYLARHGVSTANAELNGGNLAIGERLIATATVAGADLLVMGAYGHSRLRELVLGGATLSALKHPTLPLLMVH
jgi:nucleotide-binding universal stress UspA family protein